LPAEPEPPCIRRYSQSAVRHSGVLETPAAVGPDKGRVVVLEDPLDVFAEPGCVPELNRNPHLPGKALEGSLEIDGVFRQGRRELHDHRSEVIAEVGGALDKEMHRSGGIVQPSHMSEVATEA